MEVKISDLKAYHKNPRKITKEMYDLLSSTLKEYGDLSGIVRNVRTGEVLGGNQRTQFFKDNQKDVEIVYTQKFSKPTPQGTIALGYVMFQGESFNYREVDWDEKKSERANIIANKVGGFWDNDILANQFDIEDLKLAGFQDFELGNFQEEIQMDTNDLSKNMETYLEGNIKQIVLYFKKDQFDEVMEKMEKLMAEFGVENHTEVFLKLLEEHENDTN